MSVIDEVKQKTDIVEVASQYTTLIKAGRNFSGLCPFHNEKHPSFFIYPEQQSWHCFGACSTGGDVFSLIMQKEGLDFGEALRLLAERTGVIIPSRARQTIDKEKNERLYQTNDAAAQHFHYLLINSPEAKKARDYVTQRGLSQKAVNDFQLGFSLYSWDSMKQHLLERGFSESELIDAGLIIKSNDGKIHDRFRDKLMFPIRDSKSRNIGFGARALDNSLPKYINSPETPVFDKSSCLYGIDLAHKCIHQQDNAIIVEGYMDVIATHENGFANVIASMGTSITEKQISNLRKLTRNIILALDADTAGEEAALRCINYENSLGVEVKVTILPQDRDPDEVIRKSKETWQNLLNESMPIIDYTFDRITSELDLNTARDKSLAVDRLLPIINQVKDLVRQAHYLQKLARLVDVSERRLEMVIDSNKVYQTKLRVIKKPEAIIGANKSLLGNPREEYCLALLLHYPELKELSKDLSPEYFENSENREIFNSYQRTEDISLIKDKLDNTIWEHLDDLMKVNLPSNQLEKRLSDCILLLRQELLRSLERKREAVFASEVSSSGSGADLYKLKEQGTAGSDQLREIFVQRSRVDRKPGRIR